MTFYLKKINPATEIPDMKFCVNNRKILQKHILKSM